MRTAAVLIGFLIGRTSPVLAQAAATPPTADDRPDRYWLSGQANIVGQFYPAFPAAYSGPLSLDNSAQGKPTWVATIYTGYSPIQNTELILDVESARGAGVSGALGLGGLGNLDAVTDKTASAAPYIARLMVRQIIPLGRHRVETPRSPLNLASTVPERRLELRLGKMSLSDFFDLNAVGSDSHLQFLNYAMDNSSTYDIAANSRGYTYAALAELYQPSWALRFAEAFEPLDPNGLHTDWNLSHSNSENAEVEWDPNFKGKQPFTLRALGFVNHAAMGDYVEALRAADTGTGVVPDLGPTIRSRRNWGVGLNGESLLPAGIRLFGRFGHTPGRREAFQFAEADGTASFGADWDGRAWHHRTHRMGLAFAANSLSDPHRKYLELGGQSYLLGDGALTYGREKIVEAYYNLPLSHGLYTALDVQRIWNPGYNQARGPVLIFGLRLHAEADLHFH